jgi:hypothetical protein
MLFFVLFDLVAELLLSVFLLGNSFSLCRIVLFGFGEIILQHFDNLLVLVLLAQQFVDLSLQGSDLVVLLCVLFLQSLFT